jgi:hypothetical protein
MTGEGDAEPAPLWDRPYRPAWMRAVNAAGGVLRRLGLRPPRLDPPALLAEAERRTGLADWGDDRFREGLRVFVDAFESQDNAHLFGRIFFREYCVRQLVNRLRFLDDLKRHPEILEVPIVRPLFITGLPRSGTTFLHRLMCEDPNGRPLLFWETLEPSPPVDAATAATDPRIARAKKSVAMVDRLAPRIRAAHFFDAESAEECNALFAQGFVVGINGFLFDVPKYVEWMEEQDLEPGYRTFRRQLQHLSWRRPGNPWLLKAPAHMFGLDALLAAFPDACVIQTHRDPLQVLPSLCSLAAAFRGIVSDQVDRRRLGEQFSEAMARGTERAMTDRASADPARFFDVSYRALLADPIGQVRRAREYFGYSYDDALEARMTAWLAANPQHKHGVHRYSLEQFGLDAEAVNERFAPYRRWVAEHLGVEL